MEIMGAGFFEDHDDEPSSNPMGHLTCDFTHELIRRVVLQDDETATEACNASFHTAMQVDGSERARERERARAHAHTPCVYWNSLFAA